MRFACRAAWAALPAAFWPWRPEIMPTCWRFEAENPNTLVPKACLPVSVLRQRAGAHFGHGEKLGKHHLGPISWCECSRKITLIAFEVKGASLEKHIRLFPIARQLMFDRDQTNRGWGLRIVNEWAGPKLDNLKNNNFEGHAVRFP